MRRYTMALALTLVAGSVWAQTSPAPPAGAGRNGVGFSQAGPTTPTGRTPPGTPSTDTAPDQISRDTAGQQVIGHTVTPPGAVPGNTGAQGTGTR